ncbi:MAG: alpha/beta hydrolase, partial [Gemmatimonadota bacterium]|nr:alpha/beta hydrolase [Gemmatimonadota bacterium]
AVAFAAAVYVILAAVLWLSQARMIFFAPRGAVPDPRAFGLAGERVAVETADGLTLHGWYLPAERAADAVAPALIWFYGNAENVALLAPLLGSLRPPGYALLALDYRGYGQNLGHPSEAGLYQDAAAAWVWLEQRPEIDRRRVAVYGRSLGSVPALYLATTTPVAAVILDSPFTSARAMARVHYRLFPAFLVRYAMDNLARAERISAPLFIIHGTHDRIAPIRMGRALARVGRARVLHEVQGAGHNDVYQMIRPPYAQVIRQFLATVWDAGAVGPPRGTP